MSLTIKIAHDYICPWCWIAHKQVQELSTLGDVNFDWVGYELFPEELEWPEWPPAPEQPANKPATPSRMDLAYAASGVDAPTAVRPHKMRIHDALEASEYAKSVGVGNEFIGRLYEAYWGEGKEINSIDVLVELAQGLIPDLATFRQAIESKRFDDKIVKFDDEAYGQGVYNVPTYFVGDKRLAEQPTSVLKKAIAEQLAAN